MSTILRQHPDVLSLSELMATQGTRALLPGQISGQAFIHQADRPKVGEYLTHRTALVAHWVGCRVVVHADTFNQYGNAKLALVNRIHCAHDTQGS